MHGLLTFSVKAVKNAQISPPCDGEMAKRLFRGALNRDLVLRGQFVGHPKISLTRRSRIRDISKRFCMWPCH